MSATCECELHLEWSGGGALLDSAIRCARRAPQSVFSHSIRERPDYGRRKVRTPRIFVAPGRRFPDFRQRQGAPQPGVPKMHTLAHAQYRPQSPPSLCTRHGCRKRGIDAAIGWSDDEWDARTSLALFADVIFESTYDTLGHTLDLRPAVMSRVHRHTLMTATSGLFCSSPLCVFMCGSCVTSRGRLRFACWNGLRMPLGRAAVLCWSDR